MKSVRGMVMVVVAALALGCGGDDDAATVDGGGADAAVDASSRLHYSCDNNGANGGAHLCSDFEYPASLAAVGETGKTMCTDRGNTLGEFCPRASTGGGCRRLNSGLPDFTTTVWFFDLTPAQTMAQCGAGTTYVAP